MMRLHSLVCFQRFPFPHCHFLSSKFACTVCTAVKSTGDARRLTATHTTTPSCNTALPPGPTSLPALPPPASTTPATHAAATDLLPASEAACEKDPAKELPHSLAGSRWKEEQDHLCAQLCSQVQSESRVAPCWHTRPHHCAITQTGLTKEDSTQLPELTWAWTQPGRTTLVLYHLSANKLLSHTVPQDLVGWVWDAFKEGS